MAQGFNMELKSQQEWGWLLATWLFLSGTGSGLFLLFVVFGLPSALALVSLCALVVGGVVLLLELGSPLRAWRGVSRLGTSWLSRGALSVGLFVVCGFLFIAPAVFTSLPWGGGSAIAKIFELIAGLCALVITLYPGFFLAQNRSVPFWNTALLPVISWGFALMGAGGLALVASSLLGDGFRKIELLTVVLVVTNLLMVCIHLWTMKGSGGAATESVRRLNQEPLCWTFWIGVVLTGMILPLVVLAGFRSALALAGAGILVGSFLFRYCVLKVGVYVPYALVPQGMDLSKLKSTNADLQREYAGMAARYSGGHG